MEGHCFKVDIHTFLDSYGPVTYHKADFQSACGDTDLREVIEIAFTDTRKCSKACMFAAMALSGSVVVHASNLPVKMRTDLFHAILNSCSNHDLGNVHNHELLAEGALYLDDPANVETVKRGRHCKYFGWSQSKALKALAKKGVKLRAKLYPDQ